MCLDKRQLLTGLSYQKLKVSESLVDVSAGLPATYSLDN